MLAILNGRVYDPANGVNGEIRDIWIDGGKVVPPPASCEPASEIIDAGGLVVMPGGVDIHSHVAGAKVNAARKFRPEDHRDHVREHNSALRSGSGFTVPSSFLTGYLYSEMGYTTIMEAASAPLAARHAHEELADVPMVDKGVYVTMGNNHFIMNAIREGKREKARDYVAWLFGASKGYAIKIVNPGGVENWKYHRNVGHLDDEVIGFGVTPRQILETLGWINDELALPHVPHIHGLNLGQPGNADMTIQTFDALGGRRAHFCHLQFFSYGGQPGELPCSAAEQIAFAVNTRPNITVDIGQVIFGEATTMTSDGPLQHHLHQLTGNKWINDDIENETGGGIVPVRYKQKSIMNAVQWLTGLELFLLIDDPWRVFLTTDHPNAGPFFRYPHVIRLLMDKQFRAEALDGINGKARERALLPELDREYSLSEIAIITRAGPARALGLKSKGHLGPGADADVTLYTPMDDKEAMFARPRFVLKDGEAVVRDGRVEKEQQGRTFYVAPSYDPKLETDLAEYFEAAYSLSLANFPVAAEDLPQAEAIPCK